MEREKKPLFVVDFWRDMTTLGGAGFYFFVMLIVLVLGQQVLFWRLLFGFVFTGAVVVLIRKIYFKNRPEKQEYHNQIEKIDASSFPSWHAARVTFLALIFTLLFANMMLSVVFIFATLVTLYSRIYLRKHDWMDIAGGFALGLIAFGISMYI
jgi:membrane-associated phospholipid phosphatase